MEKAIATPVAEEMEDTIAEEMPEADKGFPWIYFLIGGLLLIVGIVRRRK